MLTTLFRNIVPSLPPLTPGPRPPALPLSGSLFCHSAAHLFISYVGCFVYCYLCLLDCELYEDEGFYLSVAVFLASGTNCGTQQRALYFFKWWIWRTVCRGPIPCQVLGRALGIWRWRRVVATHVPGFCLFWTETPFACSAVSCSLSLGPFLTVLTMSLAPSAHGPRAFSGIISSLCCFMMLLSSSFCPSLRQPWIHIHWLAYGGSLLAQQHPWTWKWRFHFLTLSHQGLNSVSAT